ncbi:MAG: diguanylate cyclase [Myxococcota bacterium]
MGIRGLLSVLVPGVVAAALMGMAWVAADRERAQSVAAMGHSEVRVLEAIGLTAAVYLAENDVAGLDNLVAEATVAGRSRDLLEMAVVDEEGRVTAHSDPTRFNTVMDDAFTRDAIAADQRNWDITEDELRVSVPARSGLRWGTVTARYTLTPLLARVQAARTRWLLEALAVAGLTWAVLSVALTRLVVRPLRALDEATRRMAAGDLGARVPPGGAGEIADLGRAFNGMAEALGAHQAHLERTVHERTDELQKANQRLEHLAVTDGLTGLRNHRHFQESLAAEVARASRTDRPFGLLMVDVDHFKRLNDTLGHPAGDEILRAISDAIAAAVRATDGVARYGGEEFAVLLPDTDAEGSAVLAERVRAAVAALPPEGSRPLVSVSVGVASWPRDGRDATSLVAAADRALYAAKRTGRNRVVEARASWA